MYLHRKIDDFLTAWKKNKNRLPLIVRGAMQVGKTTSVGKLSAQLKHDGKKVIIKK